MELYFKEPTIGNPKYSIEECKERDGTYAAPIRVKVQLVNHDFGDVRDVKEQEVVMEEKLTYTESYKLQYKLRKLISMQPYERRCRLRTIYNCGRPGRHQSSIDIIVTERVGRQTGEIFNTMVRHTAQHCTNHFLCPVCAPKFLLKQKEKIIRLLIGTKEIGYRAVMLTLTVPHLRQHSVFEVRRRFCEAQKLLTCSPALQRRAKAMFSLGKVTAVEATYGQNGWHIHSHILWFLPEDVDMAKVKDYLEQANSRLLKLYSQWDSRDLAEYVETLTYTEPLFISRDEAGNIRWADAADYMTASGISVELTYGSSKSTHNDKNYQLFDMLDSNDAELHEQYLQFAEMLVQKNLYRLFYSHGLQKYMCSIEHYQKFCEVFEKKTHGEQCITISEVVCTFIVEDWNEIIDRELRDNYHYIYSMFRRIEKGGRFEEVKQFCEQHNLPPPLPPMRQLTRHWDRVA